ncbi:uncharacterized protein LOC126687724 [Mercurialis annua]|uniref:uncharacterized protein LOC126687724 n=1 Tax=Mercurialis annua TaxID=3986 RepID=UPI00215FAEED|nr:uncharacterized protein LOC126687724 [Mercurialis annua]
MSDANDRKQLWRDLVSISKENDSPLIVLGDFNAILSNADRCGGILANQKQCEDFQNFLTEANLNELNSKGNWFTWTNIQCGDNRVWRKIDRALVSESWLNSFDAKASFLNHGISDHSPVIITFNEPVRVNCKPFRFFNIWTEHKDFRETDRDSWCTPTDGFKMYQSVHKLNRLKRVLRNLNRDSFNNISMQVEMTKKELDSIQVQIQRDPLNNQLLEEERLKAAVMKKVLKWEENFFRQKSRVQWIELGDLNTRFFHNSMKQRQISNRISQLNVDGENLFGSRSNRNVSVDYNTLSKGECVCEIDRKKMVDPVTNEEIKSAMFSIGSDKAPGADGYGSLLFKKCWSVIGGDICEAVRDFFISGKLLKQINATIITLNPKVENALLLSDFRPISCCNVIYKCITKIIASRMRGYLDYFINHAQSAFVPMRKISDNVLLAHELVFNYHRANGRNDCARKIDLRKAYDSVQWNCIKEVLLGLNFPDEFIKWIMMCMRTPSDSIMINGKPEGFFKGVKGIRRGDPMSPLLFVVVMEYLSTCLESKCDNSFAFHSGLSVLSLNENKSCIYFSGLREDIKSCIMHELGFSEGTLPIKYLGMPLISKRLSKEDCRGLIEKITKRITHWIVRHLSYAGRLQLVNVILRRGSADPRADLSRTDPRLRICNRSSGEDLSTDPPARICTDPRRRISRTDPQVYWASIFILPMEVLRGVESLCRNFLWKGNVDFKHGSMVAWKDVCKMKSEGGLGVKDIVLWNRIAIMKHVWELVVVKDSLWAKWIIKNKLKMLSFWGITKSLVASWSWRNLCKIRQDIKGCFSCDLGKGDLSFWFDPLFQGKAIVDMFPSMSFIDADIPKEAKVRDVWRRGDWRLPDPVDDMTEGVWDTIKIQLRINDRNDAVKVNDEKVPWWKLIWSPGCVPRQSFIAWLAVRKKLKTRDKLKKWGCVEENSCVLCNEKSESIEHLFFNCKCTKAVMSKLLYNGNIHRERKKLATKSEKSGLHSCNLSYLKGQKQGDFEKVVVTDVEIFRMIRQDVLLKLYGRQSNTSLFFQIYKNWLCIE